MYYTIVPTEYYAFHGNGLGQQDVGHEGVARVSVAPLACGPLYTAGSSARAAIGHGKRSVLPQRLLSTHLLEEVVSYVV